MSKFAIDMEKKFRFALLCFSTFTCMYAIVQEFFRYDLSNENNTNYTAFAIIILLSILFASLIWYEINEFLGDDWDWKPKNWFERLQNEFFGLVGIGTLYFVTQMGIMVLFFPSFEEIMILQVHVYAVLFSVVSVLVFLIYRMTILKFE